MGYISLSASLYPFLSSSSSSPFPPFSYSYHFLPFLPSPTLFHVRCITSGPTTFLSLSLSLRLFISLSAFVSKNSCLLISPGILSFSERPDSRSTRDEKEIEREDFPSRKRAGILEQGDGVLMSTIPKTCWEDEPDGFHVLRDKLRLASFSSKEKKKNNEYERIRKKLSLLCYDFFL